MVNTLLSLAKIHVQLDCFALFLRVGNARKKQQRNCKQTKPLSSVYNQIHKNGPLECRASLTHSSTALTRFIRLLFADSDGEDAKIFGTFEIAMTRLFLAESELHSSAFRRFDSVCFGEKP
jgi:hypothetical protein